MLRGWVGHRHGHGADLTWPPSPAAGLAPPLAEVELPAPNVGALLRRNADRGAPSADRRALCFGEFTCTHTELLSEAERFAALFGERLDPRRPPHVAVLLDNTPDYVFALCGAALLGAAVVGLNHTRRGDHLAVDITHTDAQLLITEPRHQGLLEPLVGRLDLPGGVLVSERFAEVGDPARRSGESLAAALDAAGQVGDLETNTEEMEPDADTLWALLFTSGTSAAPKAVRCTQRRLLTTGNRMTTMLGVGPDDVGYAAMPLYHANSLMGGLAPALVAGATLALARRFSASGFLSDVRRYGVTWFNYTGKVLAYLLATPEREDDPDTTLRIAFGNEGSPQVVKAAARRFGMQIVDVFGSTEGAIALDRTGGPPPGSVGRLRQGIKVVDPEGNELPRARFDEHGRLLNADECVGEIVNTLGVGPFEGYYRNDDAMSRATRNGWYWSGDLAYVDDQGWLYFAGRNSDWLRVDGENFPAAPIEAIVARHPDVVVAAAYGVPDAQAGDQVMVAVVLRADAAFDPAAFAAWVDAQGDLSPRWRPRYVRVSAELPVTPTNKVLTRHLAHQKFRSDRVGDDPIYLRERGQAGYRRFTADDEEEIRRALEAGGRIAMWDV